MGCDIHGVWQAKKEGKWVDIASEWEQNRHYYLFSWLANVRNGYGFAGVPTYSPVIPISKPRGLPEDFETEDSEYHATTIEAIDPCRRQYLNEDDKKSPKAWLGDHSHSWLNADEILRAPLPLNCWQSGVVPREFFDTWDGHTPPEAWSGDISGRDIIRAENPVEVNDTTTHVRIFWKKQDDSLNYFIDEVKRLKELHGEVRLVFGFDS